MRTGACKNSIQDLLTYQEEMAEKIAKIRGNTLFGAIRKFNQEQRLKEIPLNSIGNHSGSVKIEDNGIPEIARMQEEDKMNVPQQISENTHLSKDCVDNYSEEKREMIST